MAVYTHVTSEQVQAFLSGFELGALTSFKGIAEGVENSNYLVVTTSDRFILTLYEKRVDAAELPFFLGLIDHLAHRGLPVPGPVADRTGALLHRLAGRPACLIHFVDGVSVTQPAAVHCHAVGRALAQIRGAAANYKGTRPNSLGPQGWQRLVRACADRLDDIAPGLEAQVSDALSAIGAAWPDTLAHSVIHADLFPDNVLFLGERISGLIDFYFACTDIAVYDLAIGLNAWAFDASGEHILADNAAAMMAGYQEVIPLSPAEQAALPLLCAGAALRFLLTRSYDWLNRSADALVTPKDPLAYQRRLTHYLAQANL